MHTPSDLPRLTPCSFNSYTQTLCVNDVVQKPNGVKASEDDLRATSLLDGPKAVTEVASAGGVGGSTIAENSGTTIITRSDGQTSVSQTVTWKAQFVDKISEITDSMNISGLYSASLVPSLRC